MSNERDTLEVGYDPTATRGVDTFFGEINHSSPITTNKFSTFIVDPSIINQNIFFLKKQSIMLCSAGITKRKIML